MRSPEAEAELTKARLLLEAAFDEPVPEDALELLGKVGDIVGTRMKKRAEFGEKLDQALDDATSGPKFKTDEATGLTVVPDGEAVDPLPTTEDVKLSGKDLAESVSRGRVLEGPGPVPGATPWVRIAEDRPYTGPAVTISRKPRFFLVQVEGSQITMEDLTAAIKAKFGVERWPSLVIQMTRSERLLSPLTGDEKDIVIDAMAGKIAELELGLERVQEEGNGDTTH